MQLPLLKLADSMANQLVVRWKAILDPIIAIPANQSLILSGIKLVNGTNVINHTLARNLVGWIIIGINGVAEIYDTQASNQNPSQTLILISNAAVTVNLEVF